MAFADAVMRCTPSLRACHQCPTHPRTIALDDLAPHPPHHELLALVGVLKSSKLRVRSENEKREGMTQLLIINPYSDSS
jgi:hypothetical protein